MSFVLGVVVAGRGRAVVADGRRASRARARFREVVLHGAKDVENEFRVSEMYLGVRGSSRFVAESDLAFFGLAGPVTAARRTTTC